eukprot:1150852-Pelagomonas_calceolata.AAC.4
MPPPLPSPCLLPFLNPAPAARSALASASTHVLRDEPTAASEEVGRAQVILPSRPHGQKAIPGGCGSLPRGHSATARAWSCAR